MNTLCHYRELVIRQVSHQYKVETQCRMYLSVLAHKADAPALKKICRTALSATRTRIKVLRGLLSSMNALSETGSVIGVNGILREGFQRIDQASDAERKDAVILQTLIASYHYKVGNYQIVLRYLQALDWEFEVHIVQSLLTDLERTVQQFLRALTCESDNTLVERPMATDRLAAVS